MHFPVLFQWQIIVACSLFAFLYAVTVREFRTEWHEKCAARVAGAVGVAMLIGFSFRMTATVDRLQHQIASKGVTSARQIAATGRGDSRGDWSKPTTQDRIATPVAGTSTTYNIGKQRTVTITEPWRWCADRSMLGAAERSQQHLNDDCGNQCPDDGTGRPTDGRGRFAFGTTGDSGSVSTAASGPESTVSEF